MSFRQQQQFESGKTSGRGRLHTHELALCWKLRFFAKNNKNDTGQFLKWDFAPTLQALGVYFPCRHEGPF
jgi:hypothetical protein